MIINHSKLPFELALFITLFNQKKSANLYFINSTYINSNILNNYDSTIFIKFNSFYKFIVFNECLFYVLVDIMFFITLLHYNILKFAIL